MNRKMIATTIVAVLSMTCLLVTLNSTEGASETQDGTSEHPFLKTVSVPKGGTKVVYVSINLTAFEFVKMDDGIFIGYGIPGEMKHISQVITNESNPVLQEWTTDTFHSIGSMNVRVLKVDDTGMYGFEIKLTDTVSAGAYFDAYFKTCSYGVSQTINYKFNVIEESTTSYTLTFSDVTIDSDGLFSSQGTLLVGGNPANLSNYSFYASGLYPGIAIHNDLSITGRADLDNTKWASGNPIDFKVTICDISSKSIITVDTSVKYNISSSVPMLNFKFSSGSDLLLDNTSSESEISVLSGTALVLKVESGTEASVVYTDDSSQVTTKTIYSTSSSPGEQTLNTSGNGSYKVFISKTGTTAEKVVTINVVGSLTALNSIRVTCAPL